MQALRIHAHGGPEVLSVDEIPRPEPREGEVLVRVLAASINHLDLWVRRGMPGFPVAFPRILGCDGTGEIAALGPGVSGPAVGTKVVLEPGYSSGHSPEDLAGNDQLAADYSIRGEHGDGFDAEYVALPARYVLPLPAGLDPVQAAAVPLVFLTAWGMLVTRAKLAAGETVLVIAGTSGVGSAGIQIAKQRGARVIATAGSEGKLALARSLGADEVVDHSREGWDKGVRKLTGGRGVDLVFEHVGPATWDASVRCMARCGRLVTCGGTTGAKVSLLLPHMFIKNLTFLGSTMGPRSALPEIFEHVAAGRFRPVVDRVLPLAAAREAHELLEARKVAGKIVLVPGLS
ncbi:MAG: zinc-binding dehydrogenase [Planctomycetes bacterium]|nr:zinc-binding dehydrogenase [Planctomycetota bacterium]